MKQNGLRFFTFVILISILVTSLQPQVASLAQNELPETVSIPGTIQSELGCSGDWQPECEQTFLVYDAEDDIWQGTFLIQPDNDQDKKGSRYKAALNKGWTENYGSKAAAGGADISLAVTEPTEVKFYYDHKTHWITDNFNTLIAVAVGDFQSELGCANDNDPTCLRGWMQDPQGTGIYSLSTSALPAGDFTFQVALDESSEQMLGADGAVGGAPLSFSVANDGDEIFFSYEPAAGKLFVSTTGAPRGDISKQTAHWVTRDTILWDTNASASFTFYLHYSLTGDLQLSSQGVEGGEMIPLTYAAGTPNTQIRTKFPQLSRYSLLKVDAADLGKIPEALRGQLAISAFDEKGKLYDTTGVQIPGVLDDLFSFTGSLGVTYANDTPTLSVWAPTAQSVALHLLPDSTSAVQEKIAMAYDTTTGVWSAIGKPEWTGLFYLYEVKVFAPTSGKVETNLVTDPYSFSLSTNSLRSQIVNLSDPALQPNDWANTPKPMLAAFEDSVVYELHIRDFSIYDESVPEEQRGTYLAFAQSDSNGMKHLAGLAEAGLTHIHLLPAFDIASINEDKSTWQTVDPAEFAAFAPDSTEQQLALSQIKEQDGFNWGYDPFHYTTPEGSYATDPNGSARILQFRQMIQALNSTGLRVVMDVVYNHTNASGQSAKSVLDKVVPGYYHRLNAEGYVETSTCCQNTATEYAMMEKLMIDSLVTWAKEYKVDGFRFDLMGHHMVDNMVHVRQALDALTLEKDGVDGSKILLYGEGWNFGEVQDGKRGINATQLNLASTGIATFNDRLRDGARGGGPFNPVQEQGFITGLFVEPNDSNQGDETKQRTKLLEYTDWIRLTLAGNLEAFELVNSKNKPVVGEMLFYNGAPAGYTSDPQEQIVYVSAHDNETLFDAIQYKASTYANIEERVRMNNMGVSLVLLSQGIPFFHAGDELLRSKSLDGNSYNSGDWFNRLDYTYQTNNWGVGLPNFRNDSWTLMGSLLADPELKASSQDIQFSLAHFKELLQIRKSSPLFRLQTAEEVLERLTFLNEGKEQVPGLIIMILDDTQGDDLDPAFQKIVVVFNANPESISFTDPALQNLDLVLHPLQQTSADERLKKATYSDSTVTVPGRTTAVYVIQQEQLAPEPTQGAGEEPTEAQPNEVQPTIETPAQQFPLTGILAGFAAIVAAGLAGWLLLRRKNRKNL